MTATPGQRRLLVVGPVFFGYHRAVADAFSRVGYDARAYAYDELTTVRAKLAQKALVEIPERFSPRPGVGITAARSRDAADAVRRHRPDIVLIVKGDALGSEFWDAVDAYAGTRATWLYDQMSVMRYSRERLGRCGPIATYSPTDAADLAAGGFDATYVPTGFDDQTAPVPPRAAHADELVFVGSRSPARQALLVAVHGQGAALRAYGREWSSAPLDRLRTWRVRAAPVPSGPGLDRARTYGLQRAALATLNIQSESDGLTIRTFEAAGVGGLQLTDRLDVGEVYEPGREVLTYTSAEEITEHCARARAEPRWARAIREAGRRRTLAEHTFTHRARLLERLWA